MVSVSIAVEESFKAKIESFPWVNWSEVAREDALKEDIFNKYIKTGKVTDEDWKFCESIDWHPVDWLPLKEEFVEELKKAAKEPVGKPMTIKEFNGWCDNL